MKIIQNKYSKLLYAFISLFLAGVNGGALPIQDNDFTITEDLDGSTRWSCSKRTTQIVGAWTYRVSSWGFRCAKVLAGSVKQFLDGTSNYFYEQLVLPIQRDKTRKREEEQEQNSFWYESGELAGQIFMKATLATAFATTKLMKNGFQISETAWASLESASSRRFAAYQEEKKQTIIDKGDDFMIQTFDFDDTFEPTGVVI